MDIQGEQKGFQVQSDDGNYRENVEQINDSATSQQLGTVSAAITKPAGFSSTNYRHVAAVHSQQRTSILSTAHEGPTSFAGFRNLMVIVLSKYTAYNPQMNYTE